MILANPDTAPGRNRRGEIKRCLVFGSRSHEGEAGFFFARWSIETLFALRLPTLILQA